MKPKRIFADANVINDIYQTRRPLHANSYQCFEYCLKQEIMLVTSCNIVTTVYYITAKAIGRNLALQALNEVNEIFELVPFDNKLLNIAIKLMQQDEDYCDLEDTLQYCMARESGCELILTNDGGFVAKELPVLSSTKFLAQHQNH